MEYGDLKCYEGSKTHCDNCGREFAPGEIITVDSIGGHAFCYSDGRGGCLLAWIFSNGKPAAGNPMKFRDGYIIDEKQRVPNYPNTPIVKNHLDETKGKKWAKNLLENL